MTTTLRPQEFELAGMVDETGFFGIRSLEMRTFAPPSLRLEGDSLVWSWVPPEGGEPRMEWVDAAGALDDFLRLRNAEDVLEFALRYGCLELCEHGETTYSHRTCIKSMDHVYCEPIDGWLRYVRKAQALLRIAAAVRQDEPTTPQDWEIALESTAYTAYSGTENLWRGSHPVEDRVQLAGELRHWAMRGDLTVVLGWRGRAGEPAMTLQSSSIFGALALQMIVAVAGAHALAVCSGCGNTHLRRRKPQAGRRNFCPSCGVRVSNLLRQRAHRERRRHEQAGSQ